jgi:hypothetical protein
VFILEVLKVLCFDTLLQVFILKVDSGLAGALAGFFVLRILLEVTFPGNVGGKEVRWLAGYFMQYYTIWLAPVKGILRSVLGIRGRKKRGRVPAISTENSKPAALEPQGCGTPLFFALLSLPAMIAPYRNEKRTPDPH